MRTTLDLADDVMAAARTLAAERGLSLGSAVSELVRRGLQARPPARVDDVPVFDVNDDAEPITPDMVRRADEQS